MDVQGADSTYDKYDLYDFHQEIVKNPTVCTTSTTKARSCRKEEQGRMLVEAKISFFKCFSKKFETTKAQFLQR